MGGGMSGGAMRGGGGISVSGACGARKTRTSDEQAASKPELPTAAELGQLNTKAWDNVYSQLELTSEQQQKVDALLSELKSTADKLAKEQAEARSAYGKAVTQTVIMESARKVMDAAEAIRNFNPNSKFDLGIAGILTVAQKAKYRELKQRS
jgi:Spy/CpxP family protein refolding chaperone